MKFSYFLFAVSAMLTASCAETSQPTIKESKDSVAVVNQELNSSDYSESEETVEKLSFNKEDMVDISNYFSVEELDKIRLNFTRELRFFSWFISLDELTILPIEELNGRNEKPEGIEITRKEKSENMDVINHIFLKRNPIFKPVPQDLFEEKMKSVFNIDVSELSDSSFYTNHRMDEATDYSTYIDLKNRLVSFGKLPFAFEKDADWRLCAENLEKKDIDINSLEAHDVREQFHKDYLAKALEEKYTMYCSKSKLEYLFHCNNYVFYDNQASLSYLLAQNEKWNTNFVSILFDFFNYDKEPRINKYKFDSFFHCVDIKNGYPLKTQMYNHLFAEVEGCPQTDYYHYFKFRVRTGMMQYVVDNCYDESDLDDCGLRKDKLICVMEDCFDYLFDYVLKGDEYKESERYHYYQTCTYLAYYLQKAYEKFVSYGNGEPRCWHNALVNNLRKDFNNNDGRFENYVKENNYFNLEGFEQIMNDAHEKAMK